MNLASLLCIAFSVAFMAVVAWVVAHSTSRWHRPFITAMFLVSTVTYPLSYFLNMGWAIPAIPGYIGPPDKAAIMYVRMVPDEAIYIIVDEGEAEARYYRFPWDVNTARAIQDSLNEQAAKGAKGTGMEISHGERNFAYEFKRKDAPRPAKPGDRPSFIFTTPPDPSGTNSYNHHP